MGPLDTVTDRDVLQPIIDRIIERMRPEAIWLFGSRAEGRENPESDFDLLAVLPDGASEEHLDPVKAWEIVRGLGVPVHLIPRTVADFDEEVSEIDTLAAAVARHGKILNEREWAERKASTRGCVG